MKDHNRENLALQRRIGELEAEIVRKDDQMCELQHQVAEWKWRAQTAEREAQRLGAN